MPATREQTVDRHLATELILTISNDGDLYRGQTRSIIRNLAIRKVKGTFDATKSLVLWNYLCESGIKKYQREFGGIMPVNKATKLAICKGLASEWSSEIAFNVAKMRKLKAKGLAWQRL